jgi:hypothetical protein
MSDERRLDRRSLFDVFRRASKGDPRPRTTTTTTPAPTKDTGFSLASFYDRRAVGASDPSPFPRFVLRQGLAPVETTHVGAGPLGARRKESP